MDLQELVRVLPKHPCDWSADQVLRWLDYVSLSHLAGAFKSNGIEGCQLLLATDQDLRNSLNITSCINRKKILNWITFLTDNARLLHSMVASLSWEQVTQEDEPDEQNIATNTVFCKQSPGTQDTVNWQQVKKGQLASTQKVRRTPSRHLNLFLYERFGGQNRFYSCDGGRNLTIGKRADNTICIVDPSIELQHCIIIHKDHEHYLKPLQSATTGVWIKITKCIPIQRTYIIEMGFTQFIVTATSQALTLRIIENQQTISSYGCFSYPSSKQLIRVGRSLKHQLSFSYDSTMSSLHGKFSFVEGVWYFQDMFTTNGSWYRCREEELITDKMTFRVGRTIYNFDCRLLQNEDIRSVSSIQSRGMCKLCGTAEKNSYFSPCAHSNSCLQCAMHSTSCLQCNKPISSVHKMYRQ